jgi:hypothetical protein
MILLSCLFHYAGGCFCRRGKSDSVVPAVDIRADSGSIVHFFARRIPLSAKVHARIALVSSKMIAARQTGAAAGRDFVLLLLAPAI